MKQNEDELQYKIIELFLAGVDKSKYDFFEQSLLKEILHQLIYLFNNVYTVRSEILRCLLTCFALKIGEEKMKSRS